MLRLSHLLARDDQTDTRLEEDSRPESGAPAQPATRDDRLLADAIRVLEAQLQKLLLGDFTPPKIKPDPDGPLHRLFEVVEAIRRQWAQGVPALVERMDALRERKPLPVTDDAMRSGALAPLWTAFDRLAEAIISRREERTALRDQQAEAFDSFFTEAQTALVAAAQQLQANAGRLEEVLRTAKAFSAESHAHAESTLEAAQAIAAGAQQLGAAITEISRQTSASEKAAQAVDERTSEAMKATEALSEAARNIDQVVVFIREIADKTNLLALNATIEAARAGEAGKGFAVVASEVKTLANQTAKATEEITDQIAAMQNATRQTVEAIAEIDRTAKQLGELVAAIAAAVEEQTTATGEISQHLHSTTSRVEEMLAKLGEIKRTAEENFSLAEEVQDAAESIAQQAEAMRDNGATFLRNLRAA